MNPNDPLRSNTTSAANTASSNVSSSPAHVYSTDSSLDGNVNPYNPNLSANQDYSNLNSASNSPLNSFGSHILHPTKATLWSAIATILTIGLMSTVMLSISLTRQN